MLFLVALTTGILMVLGVDTLVEAFEQAARVPGPFQGVLLVGIGAPLTVGVLSAVSLRERSARRGAAPGPWTLAGLIALGIGLHNLGEGLAIGAAYAIGEVAFGAFLVIGFILQNVTEGLAIVVPILRERVDPARFALLIAVAGTPAIAGTILGAFAYSAALATLFLAIGAGAVLEVMYEVGMIAIRESVRLRAPFTALAGAAAGALVLYVTGLLVK
jgi:zinc transporter ZupT